MDIYTITETYEVTSANGVPHWVVVMTATDGSRHQHAFPKDTVTWRAAEYGINVDDTETLLDVILHEPYITPADVQAEPLTLTTAKSKNDAKAAHLARIAAVKKRRRIDGIKAPADRGKPDPLAAIRVHRNAPERVAEIMDDVAGASHAHGPDSSPRLPPARSV
ncbi:hypothetical protein [Kitasatospora sp. NPDC047058]|uniref:hypothetical protein n=1 Tax=Kitasatospora sp. NPDC047058 TaxID=3155620 RepID=UPI0033F1846D